MFSANARKIIIITSLVGAFLLVSFGPTPAYSMPIETVVAEVQDRYDKTIDFRARFIQETTLKMVNRIEREEGTVYFKKPKRMRWEYSRPKGKLLVISPEKAWLYLPEDRLVYIQDAEKMFQSRLAIKFITGVGRLTDDFQISYTSTQKTDREGNYLLTLSPREQSPEVDKITIVVDKTSYSILQFSLSDFTGNITRIEFRNLVTNSKLPERLFRFTIPEGVESTTLP